MNKMLAIKNIHKAQGKNEVLKGVDIKIDKGDVVVILGLNDSGKTTLLRCINFRKEYYRSLRILFKIINYTVFLANNLH